MERDEDGRVHGRQHRRALQAYIKKFLSLPETNGEPLMDDEEGKGMIIFAF